MSEEIFWVVYEEEKKIREWVDMPKDYIGSPLYEHATDYITILETGERVMVRKKDGFIYKNGGVSTSDKNHLATPEEIEKMREDARRKAEERRRKGLQGKAPFVPTKHTDLRLPQSDGNWVVSRRDIKGKWVPMPTHYLGRPVIEYWNCYITDLESGERVFVNKETGKITWGSVNPERDKGHLVNSEELELLRQDAVRKSHKRKEGAEKPIKAKSVPIEQVVKDRYDEKVPWVVDLDSSKRNRWYPMPIDFKGKPTFESWDSYVTKLSDGRKVAISKKTNEIVVEGSPVKVGIPDKGSSKHKPKTDTNEGKPVESEDKPVEVESKSKETYQVGVSRTPQRSVSAGLRVISSKEELLELQAKSKSSKKEAQTKKKGVKSNVTTS
jgi:hypothetical protein